MLRKRALALAARQHSSLGRSDVRRRLPRCTRSTATSPRRSAIATHPIYGYYSLHDGTDFGAGCGQPLYAAARGKVISALLLLRLGQPDDRSTTATPAGSASRTIYNHATSYTVGVGQRVRRGQVIGYVGHHRLVDRLPPALHRDGQRPSRRTR